MRTTGAPSESKRPSVPGRGFCGVTMRPPRKPLIAAVEGYALAGGFEVVLACDLIVAARNAQFGLPEVKRGLAATAGGLMRLPKRLPYESSHLAPRVHLRRFRDLIVSVVTGAGLAALAYAMMTRPAPQSISPFYLDRALPEGGGTNVVNVMLVDFRAFDTFGEITVLSIVALTVYALLRRFRPPREVIQLPPQQRAIPADLATDLINPRTAQDTALGYMMVPATLVRLLMPVAAVVSAYLFMRGHNEPGGGFVAGLVLSIAFITQYIVAGTHWVEAHLQLRVVRWIGLGLLMALATGIASLWFGYPFMTTHTAHLTLPVVGEIHIASALFFDIAVFAVVVGSTLLILTALAHQSVRSHRKAPDKSAAATAAASAGKVD